MSLRQSVLKDLTDRSTEGYLKMAFGQWGFREDDPALMRLKIAHGSLRRGWEQIYNSHQRRMKDESQLPLARLISSAQIAQPIMERAEAEFEAARKDAEKRLKELRDKAKSHLALSQSPGHAQLQTEIRQHFKSLTGDERTRRAQQALQGGDLATVRALVSAPPFLSGIAEPTHKRLRAEYLMKAAPEEMQLGTEIENALEMVKGAAGEFLAHVTAEIDFATVEQHRKSGAR